MKLKDEITAKRDDNFVWFLEFVKLKFKVEHIELDSKISSIHESLKN